MRHRKCVCDHIRRTGNGPAFFVEYLIGYLGEGFAIRGRRGFNVGSILGLCGRCWPNIEPRVDFMFRLLMTYGVMGNTCCSQNETNSFPNRGHAGECHKLTNYVIRLCKDIWVDVIIHCFLTNLFTDHLVGLQGMLLRISLLASPKIGFVFLPRMAIDSFHERCFISPVLPCKAEMQYLITFGSKQILHFGFAKRIDAQNTRT